MSRSTNTEERLRRAFRAVAELPDPHQGGSNSPGDDRRKNLAALRRRRLRLVTTTIAVAATAAAVSLLIAYGPGSARQLAHTQVPLHRSKTAPGPSVSRTSTSPPPFTKVPPPTTTQTTPGAPVTHVEMFNPWTPAGTLSSSFRVEKRLSGYNCPLRSSFDSENPYAWRCFLSPGFTGGGGGGGAFYDPCFAPPGRSDVTEVACGSSPWSGFVVITLSRPLAFSSWGIPPGHDDYVWAMELGNGQQCSLIEGTGAEIDRTVFNYRCSAGYAAYPDTGVEPWVAEYAAGDSGPVTSLVVTTAWR